MRIGVYLTKRKQQQLRWEQLTNILKENILIDITPETIEKSGPYDVLFVRLTENLSKNDLVPVDLISKYISEHPEIKIIDPIEGQLVAVSRKTMCTAIENLSKNEGLNLYCAKTVLLDYSTGVEIDIKKFENFRFPAICKSTEASTVKGAHIMTIVNDMNGLRAFISEQSESSGTLLIQEYISHNGTIFKVFILGSNWFIDRRVSFPNFPLEGKENENFTFDSQQYKHVLPPELMMAHTGKWPIPNKVEIDTICQSARKSMNLSLFGFDLIQDSDTQKFSIIDINYLPDYVGVENFHSMLLEHLTTK
jgi:glutathione synthase/RimK-type ligase-like ATP-grasp enzyme